MRVTDYSFGSIRTDGVTYDHDLIIDRGKMRKRKKAAVLSGSVQLAAVKNSITSRNLPARTLGTCRVVRRNAGQRGAVGITGAVRA